MRVTGVALLGVVISVAGVLMAHQPELTPSTGSLAVDGAPANAAGHALAVAAAQTQEAHAKARRVYPYSIVPGGVLDRADLVRVLKTDKVAAAHYAAFQVDKASPVTVAKPRAVYVSYRKGDQVYWTSKKVMLAEGETLLSDGSSEIRTRCGNRISDTARLPVAANEPSPEVLDTAMDALDDDEGGAQTVSMPAGDGGPGGIGATRTPVTFADGAGLVQPSRTAAAMSLVGMPDSAQPRGLGGTGAPVLLASQAGQVAPTTPVSTGATGVSGATGADAPATAAGTAVSGRGINGTGTRPADGTASTGATVPAAGTQPSSTEPVNGLGGSGAPVLVSNDGPAPPAAPELPPLPGTLAPAPAAPIAPATPNANTNDVPEPGSVWLSGIALAIMVALRRKHEAR